MFSRETAAKRMYDFVDRIHQFMIARKKGLRVGVYRLDENKVNVAVADVTKRHHEDIRNQTPTRIRRESKEFRNL